MESESIAELEKELGAEGSSHWDVWAAVYCVWTLEVLGTASIIIADSVSTLGCPFGVYINDFLCLGLQSCEAQVCVW